MKKLSLLLLMLIGVSFSSLANKGKINSFTNKGKITSFVNKGTVRNINSKIKPFDCISGLITSGGSVIGYWFACELQNGDWRVWTRLL